MPELPALAVHQAAENLLTCVCDALGRLPTDVPGLAGCPCRACVVPGQPAADGCDGGCDVTPGEYPGQLTVNVARLFTTDRNNFPSEVRSVRDNSANCGFPPSIAAELAVEVWRCTPMPTNEGCPPSCEALSASAMQLHADMLAVQSAALCCFAATDTTTRKGRRYSLGPTLPLGPQGGCVGFRTVVAVDLGPCVPCPPVAPPVPLPEPQDAVPLDKT